MKGSALGSGDAIEPKFCGAGAAELAKFISHDTGWAMPDIEAEAVLPEMPNLKTAGALASGATAPENGPCAGI